MNNTTDPIPESALIPCEAWHIAAADYLLIQGETVEAVWIEYDLPVRFITRTKTEHYFGRALCTSDKHRLAVGFETHELAFTTETYTRLEAAEEYVWAFGADGTRDLSGRYRGVRREERKASLGGR